MNQQGTSNKGIWMMTQRQRVMIECIIQCSPCLPVTIPLVELDPAPPPIEFMPSMAQPPSSTHPPTETNMSNTLPPFPLFLLKRPSHASVVIMTEESANDRAMRTRGRVRHTVPPTLATWRSCWQNMERPSTLQNAKYYSRWPHST
jgi:hypothetical protein